jgi:hypothetical protein
MVNPSAQRFLAAQALATDATLTSKRPTHAVRVHLHALHTISEAILVDFAAYPDDASANDALLAVHECGVALAGIASREAPPLVRRPVVGSPP